MTSMSEQRLRLSGWCSPAALDGRTHPTEHEKCRAHVAAGRVTCHCPDHEKDAV